MNKSIERITVIDALRGLAIMAIMLLHNMERFNIYTFSPEDMLVKATTGSYGDVWDFLFFLFAGKAYAIFAFLFGVTFFIQSDKQNQLGRDFGYRYLWRLLILVGFAFFNASFFAGEVLLLFAVVGLSLFPIRNLKTQWITVIAAILLTQPVEIGRFLYSLITPEYNLPEKITRVYSSAFREGIKGATIWETIVENFTNGQKFSMLWAIENGRFVQTAGVMMLGVVVARKRLFAKTDENKRTWLQILLVGFIAAVPLYFYAKNGMGDFSDIAKNTVGTAINMWRNLAFTAVLISSFILLFYYTNFRKFGDMLVPYGRMSLSNYVGQSLIGFALYFPATLNLSPKISITHSALLGVVLFILQLQVCKWWLKSHKQGPLEALWHKLTWIGKKK